MHEITKLPSDYLAALRDACGKALDAGMFYQNEFDAFVSRLVKAADPVKNDFLGLVALDNDLALLRDTEKSMEKTLVAAPRGAWYAIRTISGRYCGFMSGGGGAISSGYLIATTSDNIPAFEDVHADMVGMEIYHVRRMIVSERETAADIKAITDHKIRAGLKFKDVTLDSWQYSTGVVTEVARGRVSLALTRRGTRFRYEAETSGTTVGRWIDSGCLAPDRVCKAAGPAPCLETLSLSL